MSFVHRAIAVVGLGSGRPPGPAGRLRLLAATLATALAGCGGLTDVSGKGGLPSGVIDPSAYNTPAGAQNMYRRTILQFERGYLGALLASGALTDELQGGDLDQRVLPEGGSYTSDAVYEALQAVRTYRVQATGALAKYDSAAPPALRGHAFALAGYAELLLADLFCSGVPLSELEFEGDFVYKPGSTPSQVYEHAITLFDSALVLAADSARVLNLARVGKGRALLALGRYDAAAAAVAGVPDGFRYVFPVGWTVSNLGEVELVEGHLLGASVSDREGGTWLPFRASGDPRTAAVTVNVWSGGVYLTRYFPAKYGTPVPIVDTGNDTVRSPVVVASGVEARLIGAEAALHADSATGGTHWLDVLNHLRTTATVPGMTGPLPALSDPGTWAARVDTLFAERAAWLFVDGHRQGDLRRLLRQYHRPQAQVYPTGPFTALEGDGALTGPRPLYGTDVTVPIPRSEQPNPFFDGCFNRNP